MPQISKGDTFANSQQLTATRLNQLVDAAQLLVGAISEQPSITANTLEATDTTLVNDGGVLKKATVGDILNSGLPVTTPTVISSANNDITITPYDGVSVLGSNYVSSDGLTVTVTTIAAHGLAVNNVVLISSAGAGYNGKFKITAVTTTTFTYVMVTAATPTASPTACTYVRKATEILNGNFVATGNSFVAGDTVASGNLTVKGNSDFFNAPTVAGKEIPQLYDVTEINVPTKSWGWTNSNAANTWDTMWNSSAFIKPENELWIIEVDMKVMCMCASSSNFSVIRPVFWKMETVNTTGGAITLRNNWVQRVDSIAPVIGGLSGYSNIAFEQFWWKAVLPKGVSFDGLFRISAKQGIPAGYANQTDGFTAISPVTVGSNVSQAYYQAEATVSTANNVTFPWTTVFRISKYKIL